MEKIIRLKNGRASHRAIASQLCTSKSTVDRQLRRRSHKDPKNLEFAKKLSLFAKKAPTPLARKEVNAAVIRLRKTYRYEKLYPLILTCMENGALVLMDFKIDTGLDDSFLRSILKEMESRELIDSRRPSATSPYQYFKK